MSRIGQKPILIPQGVDISVKESEVTVKGPKGTLSQSFSPEMLIEIKDGKLTVKRPSDDKKLKALHGLTASIISNIIQGVKDGYSVSLELVGVGYRAAKQGNNLVLTVGFSHPVTITPEDGVEIDVPSNNKIIITGADKQKVGNFAARIRRVRPPEPYKGKGIRYEGEQVRRKIGKAGK